MKFPKRIKFRGKPLATIYAKTKSYPFYRVASYVNGKRKMASFGTYSEAKKHADQLVRDISTGSATAALSASQSRDALAAIEVLESLHRKTSKRFSLFSAVTEFANVAERLNGHTLNEMAEKFLANIASVQQTDLAKAVEEYLETEEKKTIPEPGKPRPRLSPKYFYNKAIHLRRFANTFPATAVSELTKDLMAKFMNSAPVCDFTEKSKNHNRASISHFFQWAIARDYLRSDNRLLETPEMKQAELDDCGEITIYTPEEFSKLLHNAEGPLKALIAIGGFCGLRTSELLRLEWQEIKKEHIEVTAQKAKTRQRRLVPIPSALEDWLFHFRGFKSGQIWTEHEITFHDKFRDLCDTAQISRKKNALRHSFISYKLANTNNENMVALESGTSSGMIYKNYREVVTAKEAKNWFSIRPPKTTSNVIPLGKAATA